MIFETDVSGPFCADKVRDQSIRLQRNGWEISQVILEPGATYSSRESVSRYTSEERDVVRTGNATFWLVARRELKDQAAAPGCVR